MKKRTACFGWTKKFQRLVSDAGRMSRIADTLDSKARLIEADPKRREVTDPKPIRDASQNLRKQAWLQIAHVKAGHRSRVKQLRGVA